MKYAILLIMFLSGIQLLQAEPVEVAKPSDLKEPSGFTDISMAADDFSPFEIDVVDKNNQVLPVVYSEGKIFFKGNVKSTPGDKEERLLLEIIKDLYHRIYQPDLTKDPRFPNIPGKEKTCSEHTILKYAILVLERRCATKADIKDGEVTVPVK